ncbi:glycosyltransferase, partial [Acinetobacter baumannii]
MTDSQQSKPKHVMMMAAGTGGHVFPALAVAKQLQQQGCQVSWLATPTGMENRLLKDQN